MTRNGETGGGELHPRFRTAFQKRNNSGFGVVLSCHSPMDREGFRIFSKKRSDCPHLRGRGEMPLKATWIFEGFSKPDGGTGHARRRNTRGNKMPDFISLLKASLTPY